MQPEDQREKDTKEKKIIVVVDDDLINLKIAVELLSKEYQVIPINSGRMLFKYLEKNEADLILLDIQMPEMNGYQVMKQLQEDEEKKKLPVIFLTADRTPETEESCFQMGAIDFISKPFAPTVIQERIKRTLEIDGSRKNLEQKVQEQLGQLTQLQHNIILTLANLIESRDGTTGEHVKRTSIYVKYLMEKLREKGLYEEELTPEMMDLIYRAAPLHDIGKILVSDTILQKTGKLTEEEYAIMKDHAAKGGKIIRENMSCLAEQDFIDVASDIATHHHEKWNGTGYPDGLKGKEISLAARLLAVVDVFDALVSKRQYKERMTIEKAMDILRRERDISFESQLVDSFLESVEELTLLVESLNSVKTNK